MQNEERIAVLELQYRTMKRIVLGVSWVISLNFAICALIIVGFFVSAASAPDVIQAKKFEVVNGEGKTQVVLNADADGGVSGDRHGRRRLSVAHRRHRRPHRDLPLRVGARDTYRGHGRDRARGAPGHPLS